MDVLLQNRLNCDVYLKKLIFLNENVAAETNMQPEYEKITACLESKIISFDSEPYDRSYLCLQNEFSQLSFADAKKLTSALLEFVSELEGDTRIRTGYIDPRCIFFSASDPANICICNAWNFQIGPLLQTWDLTAEDEKKLLSFEPLNEEQCLESHISMAVRIMIAGKNNIDDLNSYSTPLTKAKSIGELVREVSNVQEMGSRQALLCDGCPDEIDVVYCVIPEEGSSITNNRTKLFKKLLKVKNDVSLINQKGCRVSERFVYPMPNDQMLITDNVPFSPDNVIDVFSYNPSRVNRAKISAAAIVASNEKPVYLYIIAVSSISGYVSDHSGRSILGNNLLKNSGNGKVTAIVCNTDREEKLEHLSNSDIALCCLRSSL